MSNVHLTLVQFAFDSFIFGIVLKEDERKIEVFVTVITHY